MKKRDVILGIVAAVVAVLALVLYVVRSGSQTDVDYAGEMQGVDLATGEEVVLGSVDFVAERPPYVNPATGERTVYPWFFDTDTGRRFVPQLQPSPDGPPRLPVVIQSPAGNAGTPWYPGIAEDYEVEPGPDYPLPALPS
jgi:hypothetical protein